VQRVNFDAWGRLRNANDWTFNNAPTALMFDRGWTGHEHLLAFGLINMNGRVYDPVVGRFLSPDNYIQAPDNPQSYNRYSYCLNNPLMYTDPSGWLVCPFSGGYNIPIWTDDDEQYSQQSSGYSGGAGGSGGSVFMNNFFATSAAAEGRQSCAFNPSGSTTYHYNPTTGHYLDDIGNVVDFNTVYNSYDRRGLVLHPTFTPAAKTGENAPEGYTGLAGYYTTSLDKLYKLVIYGVGTFDFEGRQFSSINITNNFDPNGNWTGGSVSITMPEMSSDLSNTINIATNVYGGVSVSVASEYKDLVELGARTGKVLLPSTELTNIARFTNLGNTIGGIGVGLTMYQNVAKEINGTWNTADGVDLGITVGIYAAGFFVSGIGVPIVIGVGIGYCIYRCGWGDTEDNWWNENFGIKK